MVTAGGRVLGVTALAPTFEEARAAAYRAADSIHYANRYFRKDIAREAVSFEQKAQPSAAPGPAGGFKP